MQQTIEGFAISDQQRRLWSLREDGWTYASVGVLALEGELCRETLWAALGNLVSSSEILRTTFRALPGMEEPVQVISDTAELDFQEAPAGEDGEPWRERLRRMFAQLRTCPFELEEGPLVRCRLVRLEERRHALGIAMPALVADATALERMADRLLEAYDTQRRGRELSPEVVQYADFVSWQSELGEDGDATSVREYWQLQVARGVEDPLAPLAREGSTEATTGPERISKVLAPAEVSALKALATRLDKPPEAVLLACWCALLHRLSGSSQIVVGRFTDGRWVDPLGQAVGAFGRYLPWHCPVAANFELGELADLASRPFPGEAAHQEHCQLSELLGDGATLPVLFEYRQASPAHQNESLRAEWQELWSVTERFAVRLSVVERGDGTELEIAYDPALYSEETARLLGDRLAALLMSAAVRHDLAVSELELLGAAEKRRLLMDRNRTAKPRTGTDDLLSLFAFQAAHNPDVPAWSVAGEKRSYRDLDQLSNRMARHLRSLGVGPESRVVLGQERSMEQVVSALGTWKAGGAFVAVDPVQPVERLAATIEEVSATVVVGRVCGAAIPQAPLGIPLPQGVTGWAFDPQALAAQSAAPLSWRPSPEHLAYGISTSGSTGRPKCVLVSHGSLTNLGLALAESVYAELSGPLKVSLNAPLHFDASIKQLVQLAAGHTLVMVPEEVRPDGEAMLRFLEAEEVDVVDCTPSQLRLLRSAGLPESRAVHRLLVGGEAIGAALWAELGADKKRRYFNVYGPTECTVDATACEVRDAIRSPSIGRPLDNVRVYVADERLRLVADGLCGELAVSGAGVARGYASRPRETARKFVPNPWSGAPGARLYRTGDQARWRGERLECLGRLDHQVKLRGWRIEPGEIETLLASHPGVSEAVAVVREDSPGDRRLVAYVTPRPGYGEVPAGASCHRLPNGLVVAHRNRNETEYLYEEIFRQRCYARHGIRLGETPVVLDVGANIGMFSLFVSRHRPRARVYAFEPLGPLYETLSWNLGQHVAGARTFAYGLSRRERNEEFTFYPRYTMMSGASAYADAASEVEVVKRFLENERREGAAEAEVLLAQADELLAGRFEGERHPVRLRRLSDVLAELGLERVDLLKVDVQRAELDVLLGLTDADWSKVDQVVMEVHDQPGAQSEGRVEKIRRLLEGRGFTVVAEQDALLEGTDRYNLYALRRDRAVDGEELAEEPRDRAAASGGRNRAQLAAVEAPSLDSHDLRELARARLPEMMVPSAVVVLEELPLTRRGKVDREALPVPETRAAAPDLIAPRNPFEEVLAVIWEELLGIERVGVHTNFFEHGGHSLLATQLMSRVRRVFEVEVPLRVLFEAPTLEALARRIEAAIGSGGGSPPPPIVPVRRDGDLPVSFAQQRLWFLDQLASGHAFYNNSRAMRAVGELDLQALEAALGEIVRRHEVLRTTFPAVAGQPVHRISPPRPFPLQVMDWSSLGTHEAREKVRRLAAEERRYPFELTVGPLLRVSVVRLGPEEHVVIVTLHHIISDAWSTSILVDELVELYQAFRERRPAQLPELPVQYADFAHWQRNRLQGEVLEEHLDYWRKRLGGSLPQLDLPFHRPRPEKPSHRGARATFDLPPELSRALLQLGQNEGATPFMTLLAGFKAFLARSTDQDDIVVGTAIAGRTSSEVERLIGFFINMLPLRTDLSGNPTFTELLGRVRQVALGAFLHQDLPFDKLVEELQPDRNSSVAPIFQVAFGLQNAPPEALDIPGLEFTTLPPEEEMARFDLTLWVWEDADRLRIVWTYSTDLFDEATIAGLHGRFERALETVAARPDTRLTELEIFTEAEKRQREETRKKRETANVSRLRRIRRKSIGVNS